VVIPPGSPLFTLSTQSLIPLPDGFGFLQKIHTMKIKLALLTLGSAALASSTYAVGTVPADVQSIIDNAGATFSAVVVVATLSLVTFIAFRYIRRFVK